MSIRHDREFWRRACDEVRKGAKLSDVARRLGVRSKTLQWWSWKLQTVQTERPRFLPVVVADRPVVSAEPLELEVNGVRVRVAVGTDPEYVVALVNAIRSGC